MSRVRGFGFCPAFLSALLLAAAGQARADRPPAAEMFGRTPAFSQIALSPNGRLLAIDRTDEARTEIVIRAAGRSETLRRIRLDPDEKLRKLAWASDDRLLIEVSTAVEVDGKSAARRQWELWRTRSVRVDGGEPTLMLLGDSRRRGLTSASVLAATPENKALTMSAWSLSAATEKRATGSKLSNARRDSGWVNTLFEVDIDSGKGRPVERGTAYTLAWLVTPRGKPIARSEWRTDVREFTVLTKDGRRWRRVYRSDSPNMSLSGVTADGEAIVGLSRMETEYAKAWRLPIDGSEPAILFESPAGDVTEVISDAYTGIVVGFRTGGMRPLQHWIAAGWERQQHKLDRLFPGHEVSIVQRSRDGSRLIARVESPSRPPVFQMVDLESGRLELLGEAYPGLAGVELGEVRAIEYEARDGETIPAYLTLPPGGPEQQLALVVTPHGGPEARDEYEFDWQSQFLATRGYAVLRPQFRGSSGFGHSHAVAGYREWGGTMQDDVNDGVRHLIAEGVVDAARVCIAGTSYGGYAALAGAAFTPELYACAASINGVSDLPEMISHVSSRAGEQSDELAYWRRHIGPATDPRVAAVSPARAADEIRAPVLLLHGIDDTVVPVSQSESMAAALKAAGKQYTFIRLTGEDHWLSREPTRIRVLLELEDFLAAHLGR